MGKSRRRRRHRRDSYDDYSSDDSYERRRRKRRRSRTPSSDRDYRSSRYRPPPRREKTPERSYRFDSPPKDQDNVMSAMAAANAIGGGLADAQNIMQSIQTMTMAQASKVDRKLYVGNLPPAITPKELVDLVNHALLKVNGNILPGEPVVSAWISSDGHYAFIEFRSPEEANNGFALNNISIHGHTLKVGRPNTYNGVYSSMKLLSNSALMMSDSMLNPEKHAQNVLDADEGLFDPLNEKKMIKDTSEQANVDQTKPADVNNAEQAPIMTKMGVLNATTSGRINPIMGGTVSGEIYRIELPSRVIVLKNIIKYEYVAYEDDYELLIEDLESELKKYGTINSIKVPHYPFLKQEEIETGLNTIENSEESKIQPQELDLEVIKSALQKKDGFGNAYVEFMTLESAKKARKQLNMRKYGELFIKVSYHSEEKFEKDDFTELAIVTTGKENMSGFEGMEHLAIEFKDGAQSSVQEEIRNQRKTIREENQLMIKDSQDMPKQYIKQAQVYHKTENSDPVIKDE